MQTLLCEIAMIREMGSADVLFAERLMDTFRSAGWTVHEVARCEARAKPTPQGALIEGAGIDTLPVREATVSWSLVSSE